jgi:hypothetical protein
MLFGIVNLGQESAANSAPFRLTPWLREKPTKAKGFAFLRGAAPA